MDRSIDAWRDGGMQGCRDGGRHLKMLEGGREVGRHMNILDGGMRTRVYVCAYVFLRLKAMIRLTTLDTFAFLYTLLPLCAPRNGGHCLDQTDQFELYPAVDPYDAAPAAAKVERRKGKGERGRGRGKGKGKNNPNGGGSSEGNKEGKRSRVSVCPGDAADKEAERKERKN